MKYCSHCEVDIVNEVERCPLCQNKLIESPDAEPVIQQAFPKPEAKHHQYYMIIRIMIFLSVVVAVMALTINYLFQSKGWWSLMTIVALLAIWISLAIVLRKRKNISKSLLWLMVWISIICVGMDFYLGWRGWSVDYVIPLMYMSVMFAIVIVNYMMKLSIGDYLFYTLLGAFFGIMPVIFIITDLSNHPLPSLLCTAASVIFLAAILIFRGEDMIAELKRRFHW